MRRKKLGAEELSEMCSQIAAMTGVGINIGTTMEILQKGMKDTKQLSVYQELHRLLMEGVLFSDALERIKIFPEMMIQMFRSAEATGRMEQTAKRMAIHYQKEHRLKHQISEALLYPKVLLLMAMCMFLFLFWFIIPEICVVFGDMDLPVWTRCLMTCSSILKEFWYLGLLIAAVCILLWKCLLKRNGIKVILDRCKVHMPVVGKCRTVLYTARFARTFSSLYGSGLSLINCMELSGRTVGNRYMEQQFMNAIVKMKEGDLLSHVMECIDGLDKKLSPIIYVGEETGKLETMLDGVADHYEYEAEMMLKKAAAMTEPVMILIMGLLIGSILLGIMLPLWNMYGMI